MKKPKFKNGQTVLADVKKLAKKHGVDVTRWAVRKWDHEMATRKRIAAKKRALEAELRNLK